MSIIYEALTLINWISIFTSTSVWWRWTFPLYSKWKGCTIYWGQQKHIYVKITSKVLRKVFHGESRIWLEFIFTFYEWCIMRYVYNLLLALGDYYITAFERESQWMCLDMPSPSLVLPIWRCSPCCGPSSWRPWGCCPPATAPRWCRGSSRYLRPLGSTPHSDSPRNSWNM